MLLHRLSYMILSQNLDHSCEKQVRREGFLQSHPGAPESAVLVSESEKNLGCSLVLKHLPNLLNTQPSNPSSVT